MESPHTIEELTFSTETSGPALLVFGAIHGDETCGPAAIRKVQSEIESGAIQLLKGSLHLVPVCNPRASEEGKRYTEDNLNRIFRKTSTPVTYEAELANELCAYVDQADVLLDIHSSHAPSPVNLFIDYPTPENEALAAALGAEFAIYDWPKVYEQSSVSLDSWTTDRYAFEAGKTGILIEAGQHSDPRAEVVAYEAILRTLLHLGMIESRPELSSTNVAKPVHMTQVFVRETMEDAFTTDWTHLQQVPKGTVVATRGSGKSMAMEEDGVIIFPKTYAKPGGEWFYLGILN